MLELRILTGLHRGAALPVDGDTIRVGSGPENDIVLLDPGMPAAASIVYRSGTSAWRYRSFGSTQPSGEAFDRASDGTALVAGARWFAGPVLIGCEEEGAPWSGESGQSATPRRDERGQRRASAKTRGSAIRVAILVAVIVLATFVALLVLRGRPGAPARASAALASPANAASAAPRPTVRVISGTLYPKQAIGRPPFAIRSASSGPYGFVVTDDDHVLIPGSRWRAFTLVRIEPGRAVFSGPHAAELTW